MSLTMGTPTFRTLVGVGILSLSLAFGADGGNPAYTCIAINDYWGDVDDLPPNLGMCINPAQLP